MNKLIKYAMYAIIGTAIGAGCSPREAKSQSLNGIESKIIGIKPIYDEPTIKVIGIEPIYDEPREKDNNKTEDYKR